MMRMLDQPLLAEDFQSSSTEQTLDDSMSKVVLLNSSENPPYISQQRKPRVGHNTISRLVNNAFNMPLITRMDRSHLHAISATIWLLGSYSALLSAFASEVNSRDWSHFATFHHPFTQVLVASGVVMSLTSHAMTPKSARFFNYGKQMRNSMVSSAVQIWVASTVLLNLDGNFPQFLQTPTMAVAILSMGLLGWDAIVEGRPWNINVVIEDLQLAKPPAIAMNGAMLISLGYLTLQAIGLYHLIANDGVNSAFAAQMAVALAITPATEAFIGTLMQKDRYTKKHGQHVWLHENADGTFRPSHRLEVVQLLLSAPGPYLMTLVLGLLQNAQDVYTWMGIQT